MTSPGQRTFHPLDKPGIALHTRIRKGCRSRMRGSTTENEEEVKEDCLPCLVLGTTVCWGASATLAAQLYRGVPPVGGPIHRAVLTAFAGGFALLGTVRALT